MPPITVAHLSAKKHGSLRLLRTWTCTGAITRALVVDADRLSFPSCVAPTEMFAVHDGVPLARRPRRIGTRSPGPFPRLASSGVEAA